jgi:hypothetical protein
METEMNRNAAITGSDHGFEWEARRREEPGWVIVVSHRELPHPVEVTIDETLSEDALRERNERMLREWGELSS